VFAKDFILWKDFDNKIIQYLKEKLPKKEFKNIKKEYQSTITINNLFFIFMKYVRMKNFSFFTEQQFYRKDKLSLLLTNEYLEKSPLISKNIVLLKGVDWFEYLIKASSIGYREFIDELLLIKEIGEDEGVVVLKKNIWRIKIFKKNFTLFVVKEDKKFEMLFSISSWFERCKKEEEKEIVKKFLKELGITF